MYYKLTLEKLDTDRKPIIGSTVMLTEEMVNDGMEGVDYLKLAADELIHRFRHEFNEKSNEINKN